MTVGHFMMLDSCCPQPVLQGGPDQQPSQLGYLILLRILLATLDTHDHHVMLVCRYCAGIISLGKSELEQLVNCLLFRVIGRVDQAGLPVSAGFLATGGSSSTPYSDSFARHQNALCPTRSGRFRYGFRLRLCPNSCLVQEV